MFSARWTFQCMHPVFKRFPTREIRRRLSRRTFLLFHTSPPFVHPDFRIWHCRCWFPTKGIFGPWSNPFLGNPWAFRLYVTRIVFVEFMLTSSSGLWYRSKERGVFWHHKELVMLQMDRSQGRKSSKRQYKFFIEMKDIWARSFQAYEFIFKFSMYIIVVTRFQQLQSAWFSQFDHMCWQKYARTS